MSNPFSLEAILRLRKHKEEAEERTLATLGAERQQVEATLDKVRQQMVRWTEDRAREKGTQGTGTAQHQMYARFNLLSNLQVQLEEQLRDVQRRCAEQQAAYLSARRGREMLTQLKEEQNETWALAKERQEQRRAEDLFLGRWSRQR